MDSNKAKLREGDSARAKFYRGKDELLVPAYGMDRWSKASAALRSANAKDPDQEKASLGYSILLSAQMGLDKDPDDGTILEQAFEAMRLTRIHGTAFVERWAPEEPPPAG